MWLPPEQCCFMSGWHVWPGWAAVSVRDAALLRGGMVLLTEILLPPIAREGTACLVIIRGQARTARIKKLELDEGFRPYRPPFRCMSGWHVWPGWTAGSVRPGTAPARSAPCPAAWAPRRYCCYYYYYIVVCSSIMMSSTAKYDYGLLLLPLLLYCMTSMNYYLAAYTSPCLLWCALVVVIV